jgi:hypothetical protein
MIFMQDEERNIRVLNEYALFKPVEPIDAILDASRPRFI